ncbi:rab11 family-interacting protein 5-like [Babylonia areolata]|uniref:rab11 family-interacting protein 5-like n=1 Tax=Babylonia areolata TaxID=304850 RepID=UPI003FD31486
MSTWSPSLVQFTVLRARNLIAKGKGGNNDVFVTIQLGKEKYQTSTIKNARNPEWFEECDLPIPHLHTEIEVTVFHRGVLSDDFLGHATIPLWEQRIHDQPHTQWVRLKNKPTREPDNKSRGEIEVKVTFHCHSRGDVTSGLKKRSSSLRNLASVVGDKLKFARSKSFRENRRDPEGGKTACHSSLQDIPEEGLTRTCSLTADHSNTMSLVSGHTLTYPGPLHTGDEFRTQSLLDLPGTRHSMVELPSSHPPPPYHPRPSSQDDITLLRPPVSFTPYLTDSVLRRDRARYDSIRERTEPESSTSEEEGEGGPRRRHPPPPRSLRRRPLSEDVTSNPGDWKPREGTPDSGEGQGTGAGPQRSELRTNGSLHVQRGGGYSGPGTKSASSGDLHVGGEVRLRKRSKRERLRMYRQGSRRVTGEEVEGRGWGLYDDSMSESCTDAPKTQMAQDLFTAYKNLTREELLRVVIQNKAQLIRKDQYIRDLESYIDNLLVRVMETQPRILHRPPLSHR